MFKSKIMNSPKGVKSGVPESMSMWHPSWYTKNNWKPVNFIIWCTIDDHMRYNLWKFSELYLTWKCHPMPNFLNIIYDCVCASYEVSSNEAQFLRYRLLKLLGHLKVVQGHTDHEVNWTIIYEYVHV